MDVHDKLDEITQYVEDARAMPMSASALVNRVELLGLLDELRELLPEELHHADLLLSDREAVVEQGRAQAEQLLAQAQTEHDRLVEQTEVVRSARERAAQVQQQAQAEATRLLEEADDYVDRKLGEFEVALDKLAQQVQRGREHLSQRSAADRARGIVSDVEPSGDDGEGAGAHHQHGDPDGDEPRGSAGGLGDDAVVR
ncbi:MAG: hypothetical protein ACTHLJ_15070 [Angustibacter sp.]